MSAAGSKNGGEGSWAWETVEAILRQGRPVAISFTGGGSRAVSWLFNHPGASRALIEAQIPYDEQALDAYLGRPGPHRAVEETARRLAAMARSRALRFSGDDGAVGLGASAALATDRDRKGQDRAFIASRNEMSYEFVVVDFDKTADRLAQEEALSAILLSTLARTCGHPVVDAELPSWARTERASATVDKAIEDLLDGVRPVVEMAAAGAAEGAAVHPGARLLVSGSFNPFHAGHAGLAVAAEKMSGRIAGFELSVLNVDKPALAYREVLRRAAPARDGRSLVLTREPTFLGKARLLPGCWFAIGYDTAVRLVAPEYYDGTTEGMQAALAQLRDLGCRFYVAGRQWQGEYRGLEQVNIPAGFADLFAGIPESEFRQDVSSTTLREGTGG